MDPNFRILNNKAKNKNSSGGVIIVVPQKIWDMDGPLIARD